MFNSGILASSLISALKAEVDVAIPISNKSYVDSLNSLEQLLYTEIIRELREAEVTAYNTSENPYPKNITLYDIPVYSGEKKVVFEDVYAIYDSNGVQLKKSTVAMKQAFPNIWYKSEYNAYDEHDEIVACPKDHTETHFTVIYFVRPALKTVNGSDVVSSGYVMVPVEFIDLVKAKLRADAYKIANEDALAAKWMNDYNVLLETFKQWVDNRRPHFGI